MSNGYMTEEEWAALYGAPVPVSGQAGVAYVSPSTLNDPLAQQWSPSAILQQGQQAAIDQNIAAMEAGLDVSTPEAQSGRTKKPLTMDQKLALRAGTEILGTTAAQAAQLGLMKLPTEATKYVAERLSEIRDLKAKGYPLSPEQERLFAEGEAKIAQQADAATRALLANRQVSGGTSAQEMLNVQKGTQATMAAAQADLTAKKAAEKAAAAESMRKEEEGLVAFVDAQQREFRDKIGQLIGGLAPILGQVFEAQGIKEQPQIEGTSPEQMKLFADLYAKDPEAVESLLGLFTSESGA